MQEALVNPKITQSKIFTLDEYKNFSPINEFLLYSDNILEGITLLNTLTKTDDLLSFFGVIYEPVDQPIYIFKDLDNQLYSIKICGAYNKWDLPEVVGDICNFIDLPDYIFYSLSSQKAILAGENTETASVGNSQWQREGRKIGAARHGVPFIYQTFYSGKDESQDTIREPSSLQVYNQLLYSIRYKVPSFVAYFENNFEGALTRERFSKGSQDLFEKYIKLVLLSDIHPQYEMQRRDCEKLFFKHMIEYLKEGKFGRNRIDQEPRLKTDFPIINQKVRQALLSDTLKFINDLDDYIYTSNSDFIKNYPMDELNENLLFPWNTYKNKQWIQDLLLYLDRCKKSARTYINRNSKVGFADVSICKDFLVSKFPQYKNEIAHKLDVDEYSEALILPLRIHKYSNDALIFSPDPESGEIVAFCELFGYDYQMNKKRPVIGYGIVECPKHFDLNSKVGTKLYKALAHYIDILILDNSEIILNFEHDAHNALKKSISPSSVLQVLSKTLTEEMAVVATYLNQTTISSDWRLCFIHTHHSSWQQLVIHNSTADAQQKVDREATKVDLILQDKSNVFMVAEAKNNYADLLADGKIKKAMKDAGRVIDKWCKDPHIKFDAFIYNAESDLQSEYEKVKKDINSGKFCNIAFEKNFVIIIVYKSEMNKTAFKLVYSSTFDAPLKKKLDLEFKQ